MGVTCDEIREELSARLDGEPAALDEALVSAHLATCRGCAPWWQGVQTLRTAVVAPTAPDMTTAILTAVRQDEARRGAKRTRALSTRVALALLGLVQIAISAPVLIFGHDHTAPVHIAHEVGSFDAALAIGLLLAAARPRLAAGMLPLVAAITGLLLITAASDVVTGRTLVTSEAPHLVDLVGFLLLARLAATTGGWGTRRLPRPRAIATGRG